MVHFTHILEHWVEVVLGAAGYAAIQWGVSVALGVIYRTGHL